MLYFRVFLFFLSRTNISSNFYSRIGTWNEIGDTNAWNRNLRTENSYSWITVVFYLANAKRILSLWEIYFVRPYRVKFSTCFVSPRVVYDTIQRSGKRKGKHFNWKYFKNDIFIVYIYIMKFLCLIKEILFSLRQTFCYNSSLSRLNSTLDFVRGVGGFKANLNWSYYVRKKVLKKS